jgi:predicted enzyme related to lactoylglutathione lyase
MSEMTKHAPGTFCWTDAGTTDVNAAKRFYGEVLGWSFFDRPLGDGDVYSMAQINGKSVAALYPQQRQMREQGIPPHWLCYFSVKSADEAASKAASLGGKVIAPAFDVFDVGRMAVLQDPTGAAVAVWQPKKHIGAEVLKEPGAMTWHELLTTDTAAAEKFYKGLLGCEAKTMDMGPMKYTIFSIGEQMVGGLMAISPEMGPIPPNWVVYFQTDDCDAAAGRAQRGGGKVLAPPMDIPDVGRFAMLMDGQGAAFGLLKPV